MPTRFLYISKQSALAHRREGKWLYRGRLQRRSKWYRWQKIRWQHYQWWREVPWVYLGIRIQRGKPKLCRIPKVPEMFPKSCKGQSRMLFKFSTGKKGRKKLISLKLSSIIDTVLKEKNPANDCFPSCKRRKDTKCIYQTFPHLCTWDTENAHSFCSQINWIKHRITTWNSQSK